MQFFKDIDFGLLAKKEISPPFDLSVENDSDLKNIHPEFVEMPLPKSISRFDEHTWKPRRCQSSTFQGFSFVHKSMVLPTRSAEEEKIYWAGALPDEDSDGQSESNVTEEPPSTGKKKRPPRKKKNKKKEGEGEESPVKKFEMPAPIEITAPPSDDDGSFITATQTPLVTPFVTPAVTPAGGEKGQEREEGTPTGSSLANRTPTITFTHPPPAKATPVKPDEAKWRPSVGGWAALAKQQGKGVSPGAKAKQSPVQSTAVASGWAARSSPVAGRAAEGGWGRTLPMNVQAKVWTPSSVAAATTVPTAPPTRPPVVPMDPNSWAAKIARPAVVGSAKDGGRAANAEKWGGVWGAGDEGDAGDAGKPWPAVPPPAVPPPAMPWLKEAKKR